MAKAKIERGLGTERTRLGRGWLVAARLGGTVAKAKIERGLGTERARLGTFRGFDTKGIVFFFYAGMDVGHSFIQIRKSCFFFPAKRKKKIQLVFFFFPRKSSSVIHSEF